MIVFKSNYFILTLIIQTLNYIVDCQISIMTPTSLKQGFLEKYNKNGGSKLKLISS